MIILIAPFNLFHIDDSAIVGDSGENLHVV